MAVTTPLFNTPIPSKIMTPDRVETRLGTLESFDGMPLEGTAATLLEHLTFLSEASRRFSTPSRPPRSKPSAPAWEASAPRRRTRSSSSTS